MYVLYESYNDNIRDKKELNNNTKIIGYFTDENEGYNYITNYVENIVINNEKEFNWFYKEIESVDLDENYIIAYDIYNNEIGNYNEYYKIILEKVEELQNANK